MCRSRPIGDRSNGLLRRGGRGPVRSPPDVARLRAQGEWAIAGGYTVELRFEATQVEDHFSGLVSDPHPGEACMFESSDEENPTERLLSALAREQVDFVLLAYHVAVGAVKRPGGVDFIVETVAAFTTGNMERLVRAVAGLPPANIRRRAPR